MTTAALDVVALEAGDAETDAELAAFFDACPTSYAQQTPGWRDVIRSLGVDDPLFLGARRGGRLVGVLPAYRFEGPLGAILTSCAQAGPLGGVASRPGVEREPVYRALLAAFVELARARGCAVASVISNPLWPDRELCDRGLEPDYALENVCQVLVLETAVDADGHFASGSSNLRRNLRKAESGALRVDEAQTRANVDEWYAIHAARHREIGATPLPQALFTSALEHMVPRDKARFFFVRLADSGEMVAGGFYVHHGAVIDALMPSVRSEHAKLAPNYLLAAHSIRWARARGLRHYNWEPSPPDGGVYRFKRQWGSRDVPYYYLTRVTGDVRPFLQSGVAAIRTHYPWHYVLPFDRVAVDSAAARGVSTRGAAWNAGSQAR